MDGNILLRSTPAIDAALDRFRSRDVTTPEFTTSTSIVHSSTDQESPRIGRLILCLKSYDIHR